MRLTKGSNQYIYKKSLDLSDKAQKSIWMIIAIVAIASTIAIKTKSPIISPIPQGQVFAEEPKPTPLPKPTLDIITQYIVKTFESEGKAVVMEAIDVAFCESSLRPDAYGFNTNGTGDYGLFQINSIHLKRYGEGFMYDWRENVQVAYKLYKEQGWRPWVCARKLGII